MPKRVDQRGQINVRGVWSLRARGYTVEETAEELGISSRSVNNYSNKAWLEDRHLSHLATTEDEERENAEVLLQLFGLSILQQITIKRLLAAQGIYAREPRANSLLR